MGWMRILNSDDVVAVPNAMAVLNDPIVLRLTKGFVIE
jgi:hypothetical protein